MHSVQFLSRRIGALAFGIMLGVVLLAAVPARAAFSSGLINVDFNFSTSATQTGAALIGSADDQWNGIISGSAASFALNTSTGAASGVTLSTTNLGPVGPFVPPGPFAATPYHALMQDVGNIGGPPGSAAITLTGLTANQSYELYFYSQINGGFAGSSTFTINGNSQTVNFDGTTGTFVEGTTYAHFTSAIADPFGTLAIAITGSGVRAGAVNGFQLNAGIPEPASLSLLALGSLGLLLRRRA